MKRIINILIIIFVFTFIYLLFKGLILGECIFKKIFNISCPGCGLTRCFKAILNLDFITAFKYNILGIPLFISIIIYILLLIIDIIRNDNKVINYTFKYLGKYYYIVIILLIISMIVNNTRGI